MISPRVVAGLGVLELISRPPCFLYRTAVINTTGKAIKTTATLITPQNQDFSWSGSSVVPDSGNGVVAPLRPPFPPLVTLSVTTGTFSVKTDALPIRQVYF